MLFHTLLRTFAFYVAALSSLLKNQTKDVLYVKEFLGHKRIEYTLLYVQLAETIFKETTDEFTVRVAKSFDRSTLRFRIARLIDDNCAGNGLMSMPYICPSSSLCKRALFEPIHESMCACACMYIPKVLSVSRNAYHDRM